LDRLPIEPLFVDRAPQLDAFDRALADLAVGVRTHLAVLGLRRIGKTLLLDEVRRRHADVPIVRLDVDAIVSTPEDFARAVAAETLRAVLRARRDAAFVGEDDEGLRRAADAVHPALGPPLDELLRLAGTGSHGALLRLVVRFPAAVSGRLDQPVLVMLDEFQDIVRLGAYPATGNLLGALRAALDQAGKVAFAVAGSRVTAMRRLIGHERSELFARFTPVELPPFLVDATHDLAARLWGDEAAFDPDAVARLQRLTGGWPFYVHAVAARTRVLAAGARITPDLVDVAFQQEIVGRAGNVALHCQYLLSTAIEADEPRRRNRLESVLREVARAGALPRARLARRLQRHHARTEVYNAINHLIDTDLLAERDGQLALIDPTFAVWLNVEQDRRDPLTAIGNPDALRRLLAWYQAQHAADRTEMGPLFEDSVGNTVRQFRGQTLPGWLFGVDDDVRLPTVRDARPHRLDDPDARYGDRADTYDIDVVTEGAAPEDAWAIECKHRAGALTVAMVERFVASAGAVERATGTAFARRWIVAPRGIRADANALAARHGLLRSGRKQLEKIAQAVERPYAVPTGARTTDPRDR
jgi:hypothetical protein